MSKNDITGDNLVSKQVSDAYRENFDRIFGKKCQHEWFTDTYCDPYLGEIVTHICSRCGAQQKGVIK